MFRTNVNEMNVEPVYLGGEWWQRVQFRLDLPPVIVRLPIAREFLNSRELDALRWIRDRFPFRPAGRCDASAEIDERFLRKTDVEGTNGVRLGRNGQISGKQVGGAGDSDAHRGGAQQPATILVDCFGDWCRAHRRISLVQ